MPKAQINELTPVNFCMLMLSLRGLGLRLGLRYPTSKVLTAIPLKLCSAHLTLVLLEKSALISCAAVPSPIKKYTPSVRWGARKYCEGPLVVEKCLLFKQSLAILEKRVPNSQWYLVLVMARYIVSYRISRYWGRIVAYPYRDNYPFKNRYSAQL